MHNIIKKTFFRRVKGFIKINIEIIAVLQLGFEKGRGAFLSKGHFRRAVFCQKGTFDAQYFVKRARSSARVFLECFLLHVNLYVINNCIIPIIIKPFKYNVYNED